MFRRVLVASIVALSLVVVACGAAASTSVSPCSRVMDMPTWSPDGTQIVYYGTRWPLPTHPHRNPNDILQALCTMKADGTNVQPLRYTVCSEKCADPPGPIYWLQDGILYLRNGAIYRIVPGSKPQMITRPLAVDMVVNPAGTRVAIEKFYPGCTGCAAPLTVLDAHSGAVVGKAGSKKLENVDPSLSPDGTQIAFDVYRFTGGGKSLGIWTANVNGSHLRRLVKVGQQPLWSPAGGKIAYVVPAGSESALRVISAGGGKSRTLVAHNVEAVFGWSPDGRYVAFEKAFDKLEVVDVATGKVRMLLKLAYSPTAVWAPSSQELLVNTVTTINKKTRTPRCWATWRVPADGSKPTRISGAGCS